jgi:uncharacterized damage-inducible protein DinB
MPDRIGRLLEHLVWADRRVLDALREADAPPPRAMRLYAHILAAEHIWASRLAGKVPVHPVWPELSLAECAGLSARNEAVYRDLLRSLDAAGLARAVPYVNSAGQAFTSTVEDILLHVCLHGQYHRGQVALLLREAGAAPATTDYIAFARGAPTAPSRDEGAR